MRCASVAALLIVCTAPALASGINTNAALAVGKGRVVSRTQLRVADLEGEVEDYLATQTLVYGATANLSLFGTLGYLWKDPGPDALTNLRLFGRHELFARDAHRETLTFSGILGVEVPVGKEPVGGGDAGLIAGAVGTWYRNVWEVDADVLATFRPDRGDLWQADVAVSRSLYERPNLQLVGVLEANFVRRGSEDILFVSPGLQLQLRGVILEASLQVPVADDATGPTPNWVAALGIRLIF